MSDKTPKKPKNLQYEGFFPVILPESPAAGSPQKNLTGLPRVVRDLVADIYNNIQRWNDLHIKGAGLVKEIASIKSDDCKDFSPRLEELINELYKIVKNLRIYRDALIAFNSQAKALEKLQKNDEPLFISLSVNAISTLVEEICKAYQDEFDAKELVLENIAYSKNKEEAMFLAALWTYQYKITDNINFKLETLLVETGHRKII